MYPIQHDATMGFAEAEHYGCLTLQGPETSTPAERVDGFASVPGPGVSGVAPEEDSLGESPPSPAEQVGLDPTDHGRTILFMPYGWSWDAAGRGLGQTWPQVISSSLDGPGGPVDSRLYDEHFAAYLVPVRPLQAFTGYTAQVRWQLDDGTEYSQVVPFTTGDLLPEDRPQTPSGTGLSAPGLAVRVARSGHRVTVRVRRRSRARGMLNVTARRRGRSRLLRQTGARPVGADTESSYATSLRPGRWTVLVKFTGTGGWASRSITRHVVVH
jgi:hypothetical protein